MLAIKPEISFPPDGWQYFQPEVQWRAPNPLELDRYAVAEQIATVRRANPHKRLNADLEQCRKDLETFNAFRLRKIYGREQAKQWVIDSDPEPVFQRPAKFLPNSKPEKKKRKNAVAKLAAGARTLSEWLSNGAEPVPTEQAQHRADGCIACPMNRPGSWFSGITNAVADTIKAHLESKAQRGLSVLGEERLGECSACGCVLSLKVWVPADQMDLYEDMHSDCWLRREKNAI